MKAVYLKSLKMIQNKFFRSVMLAPLMVVVGCGTANQSVSNQKTVTVEVDNEPLKLGAQTWPAKFAVCKAVASYLETDGIGARDQCLQSSFLVTQKTRSGPNDDILTQLVVNTDATFLHGVENCLVKLTKKFLAPSVDENGHLEGSHEVKWLADVVECDPLPAPSPKELAEQIFDLLESKIGGGDLTLEEYDVGSLDPQWQIEDLVKGLQGVVTTEEPKVTTGFEENKSRLLGLFSRWQELEELLDQLRPHVNLSIHVTPGDDCVETEYCSVDMFEFYTRSGDVIYIHLEDNT